MNSFKEWYVIFRMLLRMIHVVWGKKGWMGNIERRRCVSSFKMLTQLETGSLLERGLVPFGILG